jgi:hypothetical protein
LIDLGLPFADSSLVDGSAANANDITNTIGSLDGQDVKEYGATVHSVSIEQFMDVQEMNLDCQWIISPKTGKPSVGNRLKLVKKNSVVLLK